MLMLMLCMLISFVATPRLAELMYMIYHKADVESARATLHGARIRFLEHILPDLDPVEMLKAQDPPRLLKTHLPATFFKNQLANPDVKAIQMVANPRDVLVSFYKFYKANPGYVKYPGDWNDFFELFKNKRLMGGDWFEHARSWLNVRHQNNVRFLLYEEVLMNPEKALKEVAEFCGQEMTEEEVIRAADYLRNEVPNDCPIDSWKEFFTPEQDQYFTELYKSEIGQGSLPFY